MRYWLGCLLSTQGKLIADQVNSLSFSRSRQETGSFCGPAVIQMMLSSLGIDKSQREISDAYAAYEVVMKEGIPLKGLAKSIKSLGLDVTVWQKYNSSVDDITKLIETGIPVGFDWQGIFDHDEYGDEYWNFKSRWKTWWEVKRGIPQLSGDQGHYCIALEVNNEKGFLRFADPYGHYAGKDRFVALWEFEERWWDDRLDKDDQGNVIRVLEEKLIFVVTKKEDEFPLNLGMERA